MQMIPGFSMADATGWGVAALMGLTILFAFMRGRVIPRLTYLDMKEERDFHRAASETKDDTIVSLTKSVEALQVSARATTSILQALPLQGAPDDVH